MQLRCPMRGFFEDPEAFNALMERYRWMKAGHFPEPGLWIDQPAKLLDLMAVIDQALDDAAAEKRRKQEASMKKPPGPPGTAAKSGRKPGTKKYPRGRGKRGRRR